MMEESAGDDPQDVGHDPNIAAQLFDAAQTTTSDDTWEKVAPPPPAVAASPVSHHVPQDAAAPSLYQPPPLDSSFQAAAAPPPPRTGFVSGHASIANNPTRRVFATDNMGSPNTAVSTSYYSEAPANDASAAASVSSPYASQQYTPAPPPVGMQMPRETTIPFNVQIDQGYAGQGQGYQGYEGQGYQGYEGQGYAQQQQQETGQEGGGFLSWFTSGTVVSKVMEKAKSSVESVITTLDPGMKEVLHSGGDVSVVVASVKEVKVGAVRQAFQDVFGRATVTGMDSQPDIAPQPVGVTAGLKGCEERVENMRRSGAVPDKGALVAVENFIVELLPERWFDIGCCLLRDHGLGVELVTFTMATPIPAEFVLAAHDQTPADYGLRWSGLAVTVGQVISQSYPHIHHADWHLTLTGVSRRDMIYQAAKALAGMYKQRLLAPSVQ